LDKKAVESGVDLVILVLAVLAAVGDSGVNQLGVLGLFRGSENQGRVGGGILWLVLGDGCKVARVADDDL